MKEQRYTGYKPLLLAVMAMVLSLSGASATELTYRAWQPDSLGDGYMMSYVTQADDDHGKPQRCTIIRKEAACDTDRAVLYIHGYNDYFFQKEEGDVWTDSCFNFYAVDLRGYGRSILPGQTKFMCRSISEYYADIDSALAVMRHEGNKIIVMMGHSTGGLIAADYMGTHHPEDVKALILNSPFLDWNFSGFMRKVAIPFVSFLGGIFPDMKFSQGNKSIYDESLRKDMHGRWEFNHAWKVYRPEKVTAGWIRAISRAQKAVRKGRIDIPVLLMHSDKSVYGKEWNEQFQHGDAVLNVERMAKYGKMLGPDVTEVTVPGALHDIFLSSPEVVDDAFEKLFSWLDKILAEEG